MCGPPPRGKICVEDVDTELLWALQVWKEHLSDSQAHMSENERENMKSADCIEWFCSLVRGRLEEWKKDKRHSSLFELKYYPDEKGYLVR